MGTRGIICLRNRWPLKPHRKRSIVLPHKKKGTKRDEERSEKRAQAAAALEGMELTVGAKVNEDGVLYGAVSAKEIVAAAKLVPARRSKRNI